MSEREELVEKHKQFGLRLDELDREHQAVRQQYFHAKFWRFRQRARLMKEANRIMAEARDIRSRATGVYMVICVIDGQNEKTPDGAA